MQIYNNKNTVVNAVANIQKFQLITTLILYFVKNDMGVLFKCAHHIN